MNELLELKIKWLDNLENAIKLNAPKGEVEMIKWFLKDINEKIK
jgi:hypothetical protein